MDAIAVAVGPPVRPAGVLTPALRDMMWKRGLDDRSMERWKGFLGAAKLDLAAAASCERDELWAPAAFHWQQAAEKSLKALLSRAGANFPPTHDLRTLAKLTEKIVDMQWPSEHDLIFLTNIYAMSRYPLDLFENETPSLVISKDLFLKISTTAKTICETVTNHLKEQCHDESEDEEAAGRPRPPGP